VSSADSFVDSRWRSHRLPLLLALLAAASLAFGLAPTDLARASQAAPSGQPGAQACVTATSGGAWLNQPYERQAGVFAADFDATPSVAPVNSMVGLSQGAQTTYPGFAAQVRFSPTGNIDARNGSAFAAVAAIPYRAGTSYHFRLIVNVPQRTYSVFVTPAGGTERPVGIDYKFRTEQSAATGLDSAGVAVAATPAGTTTLCDLKVNGSAPPPPPPPPPPEKTPVAINGKLRVCGLKLCNQYGREIQLRGMSTHGLQWHGNCINDASLDALAKDWEADVIRISMYVNEGGYRSDRSLANRVNQIVDMAEARGMYAIIDWHQLSPGNPNSDWDLAQPFWRDMATRHKDRKHVLYDVANEPNGVSWAETKRYHDRIIPVIRAVDPSTVILLGTHAWGSMGISDGRNENDIVNNPVRAENIMYTFHFYAGSHRQAYLDALDRASNRIPVFVTEFGTQSASGDGANNRDWTNRYLGLMQRKQISWANWNYSHDHRSGAVFKVGTCPNGPFVGVAPLKEAGQWIRQAIKEPPDNFPTE
jgi:endoglucanase